MSEEERALRILRELDEGTDWELSGKVPTAGNDDDSLAAVPAGGDILPFDRGLDSPETITNILSCVGDMDKEGLIADIIVVVNKKDDEQLLFTTVDRNDRIIGMMEVAQMNWYNTQIWLLNSEEAE